MLGMSMMSMKPLFPAGGGGRDYGGHISRLSSKAA